jgi:Hemopexin
MMSPDAVLLLPTVDAIKHGAGMLYFFKNAQFACWDVAGDTILPGYPRNIAEQWPGLLDYFPGVKLRGALHVPEWGNKIYFFFEGQTKVAAWNMSTAESELIDANLLLPCDFTAGKLTPIAARLPNGQSVIYGFHGLEYVRWTVGAAPPKAPDAGFPKKIADDWKDGLVLAPRAGVYVDWPNRSSAHSNRKIYFFMGDLYLRWDVPSNSRNYRLDILAGWKGWPVFA